MDKILLRDTLFKKYFQIENGISVKELNEKLSFIPKLGINFVLYVKNQFAVLIRLVHLKNSN